MFVTILFFRKEIDMKLLEDRILKDGHIGADNVLKVDSFLNHQIDVSFVCELGKEFYRLFKDENITKILTIEASGIGIACLAAQYFGVPVVLQKDKDDKHLLRYIQRNRPLIHS